jgi:hypothetical protein
LTAQILTAELARNADACIGLLALGFVLFDSLTKKADVTTLKEKLSLYRKQLLGNIVSDLEQAVASRVENIVASHTQEKHNDQYERYISPIPAISGEAVRDALTEAIRSNDDRLALVRKLSRIPKTSILSISLYFGSL